jgi:hypothetical protein
MSDKRSILVIAEGEKTEPNLIRYAFEKYQLSYEYEVYSYCTNVYDLYDSLFEGNDAEDIELLGVLKERERASNKNAELIDRHIELLSKNYTDVILLFDFDPQDNRYDSKKLLALARYLSNTTEEGKLYLSFPMCEAYKYLKTLPDIEFLSRRISAKDIRIFKTQANNESCIQNPQHHTREHFDWIISHNLIKAFLMLGVEFNDDTWKSECFNLNHLKLINQEIDLLENENQIEVLSTSLFFICELRPDAIDFKFPLERIP